MKALAAAQPYPRRPSGLGFRVINNKSKQESPPVVPLPGKSLHLALRDSPRTDAPCLQQSGDGLVFM